MAGQGNGTFKQIWSTFLKVTGLSSADTPSWLRSLVALNLRSNLDLSQKNCLHFCLAWVFWGSLSLHPFSHSLLHLQETQNQKIELACLFRKAALTYTNGRDHTTVPFTSWTYPFHQEGGVDWGQNQDWFSLLFSCSHSGNSSKLSTRSGRVKLLKVTGGIRGRDWVLTHYAMMLREKCDGNSEMQSFHNAAGKEVMTSVMTDEQLTLLLLHLIYNL